MKTTLTMALVAVAFFLVAPAANAEEKDLFHPSFSSIMIGFNFPENEDFDMAGECFFVGGFMVNPYFGYQMEFDATTMGDENGTVGGTFYAVSASLKLAFPVAFVEPYVLGGAGLGGGFEGFSWGFPMHAAFGIDFNFGKVLVGAEARQVWLKADGQNFDALLVMTKFGFRF